MATTAVIRNGLCIKYNNSLFTVVEFQHVKPGKGPAFVRTKLKNLTTGKVIDNTFSAGHKIEPVRVERKEFQFLYSEGDLYHFMNTQDYEQVVINQILINSPDFLKEGNKVEITFNMEEDTPLLCELPVSIDLEVTHTEPGVKGDTVTNSTKQAVLEVGKEIKVPLFINIGNIVKVDTRTGSYIERVKK